MIIDIQACCAVANAISRLSFAIKVRRSCDAVSRFEIQDSFLPSNSAYLFSGIP